MEFPAAYNFYEEEVSWIETTVRDGVTALDPGTPLYGGLSSPSCRPISWSRRSSVHGPVGRAALPSSTLAT
ncbi:MAG: hypothetical protein BRD27_02850 [Bacteroidetes bacterium QH_10_64_19]|nr:MAG: hypothetical protein BRD27_02850 [Bacteroidetes bacterium QH_10_64_19]